MLPTKLNLYCERGKRSFWNLNVNIFWGDEPAIRLYSQTSLTTAPEPRPTATHIKITYYNRRRWANIHPTLVKRIMFTGITDLTNGTDNRPTRHQTPDTIHQAPDQPNPAQTDRQTNFESTLCIDGGHRRIQRVSWRFFRKVIFLKMSLNVSFGTQSCLRCCSEPQFISWEN